MSKTYIAAAVTLIASFTFLSQAQALEFVNAAVLVATTLMTFWGRWKAGGISIFGIKD